MKPYGRPLAALLLVALTGCGSGGPATPTAAKTTDEPTSADARPIPAPAASGTLAYVLDGDVYVADPDGSHAVKILDRPQRSLRFHPRVLLLGRIGWVLPGGAMTVG